MAIASGNDLAFVTTYLGALWAGAVAVPLSPLLTAHGLRTLLSDAAPRVVFANQASRAAVACSAAASLEWS